MIRGRREFLRAAALAAAATAAPRELLALLDPTVARPSRAVRVRGRIRAAGEGLAGVAVSDGLQVVTSAADGTYELVTDARRDFVRLTVPSRFRIPRNPAGTARFYGPIEPDPGGEAAVSFDLEPVADASDRHAMIVLGDPQTQNPQEMAWFHEQTVPDVSATVRNLGEREVFGVACGDIVYDRLELYPEYERAVGRMEIPFFQVIGNHDLDQGAGFDESATTTFTRHFGPRYYSFERGAVHYAVLDDVFWYGSGYLGYLDVDQLTWLAADLARVEAGRTVVVLLHIPTLGSRHEREGESKPSVSRSVTNREVLYRLLEPYRAHVIAGHMHESEHVFRGSLHEHVCGAACGAWWSGPICGDGTPNGYAVYEIEGERVRWRYKATGMPADSQITVHAPGADPSAPADLLANVWDWDPGWTVHWFEDGEPRGAMARTPGRDPESVRLHLGPDRPLRRTWVEPYPVGHLFRARPNSGARRVTVEAVDRFERSYRAEWIAG